ncbi:MAG TPA: DUF3175 domain-containing protein [Candidatus Binatus sp.]|nr:DUF3175 domain-containing protein [Candidatus Binatus sp.]
MRKKTKRSGRSRPRRRASAKRWSQRVTQHSNSLDLEGGVFSHDDPKDIAASLKRSAERSKRRKGTPYQSAMSMLNFYINRAGAKLPKSRRAKLQRAKSELRALFGR